MKSQLLMKASRKLNKVGFQLKKHSPEILVAAGIVGTVTSTVLACKATLKVSEVLADSKDSLKTIHDVLEDETKEYTQEDAKKDTTIVYVQTAVKVAKLYAPAVILGGLSITGIVASNNILRKRNAALAAAYVTIDKSFKEYRGRVAERFGADVEEEIRYNIKSQEIEKTVVDENGNETTVKETVKVADPNLSNEYARYFDHETSVYCEENWDYNMAFLTGQQEMLNKLLVAQGHVTLNDVYRSLGIESTKAGMVVGWVYNPDATDDDLEDNQIDFRIREVYVDDPELTFKKKILLDFNVDGLIYDKM